MNSATDPTTPGGPGPGGDARPPGSGAGPGSPAAPSPAPHATRRRPTDAASWGRVDDDGTVYVRTADGERQVGQWPDGDPGGGARLLRPQYDALVFEVELLEQRVGRGRAAARTRPPARSSRCAATVAEAQAVGDLDGLEPGSTRWPALIATQREQRREERAQKRRGGQGREGADRRRGRAARRRATTGATAPNRMRELLDEWKALPRLEKSADDALWRRFSTARTTYTRRRKSHFAELNEKREGARVVKEKLVKEAEALAGVDRVGPDRPATTAT